MVSLIPPLEIRISGSLGTSREWICYLLWNVPKLCHGDMRVGGSGPKVTNGHFNVYYLLKNGDKGGGGGGSLKTLIHGDIISGQSLIYIIIRVVENMHYH